MTADLDGALRVYQLAYDYVHRANLLWEVDWQRRVALSAFEESDLLREAAWVVLCSGFRESVVRQLFDHISLCFCDWESATAIIADYPACKVSAGRVFRNRAKLDAIVEIAVRVDAVGFSAVKSAVMVDPIGELRRFPFIGPVTVWHLAKNLGLNSAKPDRHLSRISRQFGFVDANAFCRAIGERAGEEPRVVDLIVWRFLADNPVQREASVGR